MMMKLCDIFKEQVWSKNKTGGVTETKGCLAEKEMEKWWEMVMEAK